ncbi:MAG: Cytochrome c oxidase caa3-type, assembly factor CtaG-related protein [Pseudonocardiales bacterium]|nr:Cytochrome c oxidase caa3-type, assembly factor CtaG-related protein [Pseudonocardiales bacterium]
MTHAAGVGNRLPSLSVAELLTRFEPTPIALAAAVAAIGWYGTKVHRLGGRASVWPVRRTATFYVGVLFAVWTTCGGLQVYASSLFWVWTSQVLLLLLVAPVIIVAGQPVELARVSAGSDRSGRLSVVRLTDGPVGTFVGHALVGPALIPVLSVVLFFGPVPGWSIAHPAFGWVVQLLALLVGCLIVLPAIDSRQRRQSLVVGLALAIGFVELLLDAIPGIILRLQTHLSSDFAVNRHLHPWSGSGLHDQQAAGTVLWSVAELLDLPFLVLLFVRWVQADARDAVAIDTAIEEAAANSAQVSDEPWWLSDPQQKSRRRS